MKKLFTTALLLLAACAGFTLPEPAEPPSTPGLEVQARAVDSTVALVDGDFIYCSGVVWQNHVLTAAHCVDDGAGGPYLGLVEVAFRRDLIEDQGLFLDAHPYEVTQFNNDEDFALLAALEDLPGEGQPLAESVTRYEPVRCIGHPSGFPWTITTGHWQGSKPDPFGVGEPDGRSTCLTTPGNSGGPVYNEYGEIVGIASWYTAPFGHLNGNVPLWTLREHLL